MLRIHSFESMGTFDGPGLRLVVFLQGCNFRCLYCANPDTIDIDGGHEVSDEEIIQMAMREKPFFGRKGGVTFSGGEPLLQAPALLNVVRELKRRDIHVCIDSNGSINSESARELLTTADLTLLDIKQIREEKHKLLTSHSNANTLSTARFLEENGKEFWIRLVIVPGYSDSSKDIQLIGETFGKYKQIRRIELLPYHTLGVHKYAALNWEYKLNDVKEPMKEEMEEIRKLLQQYFPAPIVIN